MKTLVIGLGNPILTDDGVGVKVAYALEEIFKVPGASSDNTSPVLGTSQIDITEASVGGLRLMEMMVGYDKAIIIDALTLEDAPPGSLHRLTLPDLEALSPTQHSASAHDTNLVTALETGRRMGLHLPEEIAIFAVTVENITDFGDQPSAAVRQAIPRTVAAVLEALDRAPSGTAFG